MPKFRIMLTRDRTESGFVEVVANSLEAAQERALLLEDRVLEWLPADGPCCDAYIADEDGDEHEEIEP